MNFQTDSVQSTFNEREQQMNMQQQRSSQRTGTPGVSIGGNTMSGVNHDLGSSIVGMNINGVGDVRNAIDNYCSDIETYLRNLDPTANSDVAFKSDEVKAALANYMEQVSAYCMNLVSQLRAFSDKIADARNQWQAATGQMADKIGQNSGSFSTGSQYQSNIQ